MISFCAAIKLSSVVPEAPLPMAWLCAATNSSLNGFTSRKKMSLRVSVEGLPRATSRARA